MYFTKNVDWFLFGNTGDWEEVDKYLPNLEGNDFLFITLYTPMITLMKQTSNHTHLFPRRQKLTIFNNQRHYKRNANQDKGKVWIKEKKNW